MRFVCLDNNEKIIGKKKKKTVIKKKKNENDYLNKIESKINKLMWSILKSSYIKLKKVGFYSKIDIKF